MPRRRFKKISAAISLVNTASHEARPGATNPITISPTAGNFLVVFVQGRQTAGSAFTINSVTDNGAAGGSTYSPAFNEADYEGGNQFNAACFFTPSVAASVTTVTVNFSVSINSFAMALQYSGLDPTSPLDQVTTVHATGSGTTATAASKTTTAAEEVIIGCFAEGTGSGFTWSNSGSYVLRVQGVQAENGWVLGVSDQIVSSISSYAAAATISTSSTWFAWMATFRAPLPALDQSAYLWRNDDGTEDSATNAANENTQLSAGANLNYRPRIQVNATNNPTAKNFQIEYRKQGTTGPWHKVGE